MMPATIVYVLAFALNLQTSAQTGAANAPTPGYVPPPLRPAATPFVPGQSGGVPQIAPVQPLPIDTQAPPKTDDDADKKKNEQLSNALGQLMNAAGGGGSGGAGGGGGGGTVNGRSESAGSGGVDTSPVVSSGTTNALEYTGETSTRGGREFKNIQGCSKQPGKFSFIYGKQGSSCTTGKDGKLKMAAELADFMDRNLNRCAAKAAGVNSVTEGIVYHAGTIGDLRHQKTGSLHNLGLAIDVKAMKVNGKTYVFENSGDKGFFNAFRECWGDAANKERGNCLKTLRSGKSPGTIGEENHAHTHHLHLSLPLCPAEARRRGVNIALLRVLSLFAMATAHAEDDVTVTRQSVNLRDQGKAELTITDQNGEPVDADQRFRVTVRCARETKPRVLVDDLGGCEFASFTYLAAKDVIELRYRVSVPRDGELFCGRLETKLYPPGCPR